MRLPRFVRHRQRLAENAKELEFYLETETQANMELGMSHQDAYAAACRKLGNRTSIREDVYYMAGMGWAETVAQDALYALRVIRKSPVLTLTILLTLGLGIGGNTAAFSVVHALLLRPLQYHDPDRLMEITADYPRRNLWDTTFSKQEFDKLKAEQKSFAEMGSFLSSTEPLILSGEGEPEALKGARVSANFLRVLGVRAVLGRGFLPQEEARGGPDVAMLSNELWDKKFGGDPQILGKTVDFNSTPYTIIGILPRNFTFPMPGVDVWMSKPSSWSVFPARSWDIVTSQTGFGRLKPGVTFDEARAEMNVLNARAARADTGLFVPSMRVTRLSDHITAHIRLTLWIIFGVVGFVLVITCVNVANLMLVRTNSRLREFAIRTSLGASSARLVRQILTESILLSLLGGGFGLLLAKWAIVGLGHIALLQLPGAPEIRLDAPVGAFTFLISFVTGILFGLLPSMRVLQRELINGLRETGATAGKGTLRRSAFFAVAGRGCMVTGQIAMSMVLLIGATLLVKSFLRLQDVDTGFRPSDLLTAKIALAPARYDTGLKRTMFADQLLQRVGGLPGVLSSAMALSLPSTAWYRTNIQIEGKPWDPNPGNWPSVQIQSVTPSYFRTLEIPIERGRLFSELDSKFGAPPAIIINESFARRFWPAYPAGENPIGARMREGADKTDWVEIVGIVADVREGGLAMDLLPEFYVPWTIHSPQTPYLVVRADRDPLRLANSVRNQLKSVDPNEALSDVQTMSDVLESPLGQRRMTMWVVTCFAGMAFLLAVVGIYGLVAYSVAQRTQELGIRRALGAQKSDILRLVLGRAFVLAFSGAVLGVLASLLLTKVMRSLLFQVSATDPFVFFCTVVVFLLVVMAASLLPARRAAATDPMHALRVG